jgi:hypothetical protein
MVASIVTAHRSKTRYLVLLKVIPVVSGLSILIEHFR